MGVLDLLKRFDKWLEDSLDDSVNGALRRAKDNGGIDRVALQLVKQFRNVSRPVYCTSVSCRDTLYVIQCAAKAGDGRTYTGRDVYSVLSMADALRSSEGDIPERLDKTVYERACERMESYQWQLCRAGVDVAVQDIAQA
ncbi:hypothetical protein HY642_05650 [Candidatus Woesearchaeota archaeon]|nr:hypothetical protein [Candidatus Woesearchaeota archaeon]